LITAACPPERLGAVRVVVVLPGVPDAEEPEDRRDERLRRDRELDVSSRSRVRLDRSRFLSKELPHRLELEDDP
jgi:hypothetical protein